jgi:hypothetical protein
MKTHVGAQSTEEKECTIGRPIGAKTEKNTVGTVDG